MELRYCKKCNQMTNHRVTKLPLMIDYDCLKCETLASKKEEVKESG